MKTKIYFLMCGLIFNAVSAQSFDNTFGTNGKLTLTNIGDIYSSTETSSGKVLATGSNSDNNAVIVKFLENGSLDTSFGNGGKVILNQFALTDYYEDAGIPVELPNGKVLVGYAYEFDNGVDPEIFETKIVRLNADGSLDGTFNNPFYAEPNNIYNFVVLPSGKILGAGDGFLRRYNADGSVDTTYGTNGTRTITFDIDSEILLSGSMIFMHDVTNNRIVKLANEESTAPVFYSNPSITINHLKLKNNYIYVFGTGNITKLDTNFNPVNTFGVNGTSDVSAFNTWSFYDSAIQPGGSILVFNNESTDGINYTRKISRFNPNGGIDTTFGTGGHFTYPFTDTGYLPYDAQFLLHNLNGKLYIADLQTDPGNNIILTRLNLPAEASLGMAESNSVGLNFAMENPVKDYFKASENLKNPIIYSANGGVAKILRNMNDSVSDLKPGVYILTGTDKTGKKVSEKFIKK